MAQSRAARLLAAIVGVLLCVGVASAVPAVADPGARASAPSAARSPAPPPHPKPSHSRGISGRPIPATAGPPVRSCAGPRAGRFACMAVHRSLRFAPMIDSGAPYGLSPADIQSAYALPGGAAGSGQTVWIVDAYDDPSAESDLAVYRAQYGLPPCTTADGCFRKLNQDGVAGNDPAPDPGWAGEIALDLAMVSATCPNCSITLVEADDAGWGLFDAIHTAVSMGAKFVSLSWGGGESGSESTFDGQYFAPYPGVVFTAATGDGGYPAGVIYPATSPYVVAVGGTSLTKAANARGWTETAWAGAGSGCSGTETRPAWQTVPPTSVCARRAASDVAAVADPATGVAVYQTYGGTGWTVYGGTSAATPIIASVFALAGTPGPTDEPTTFPYLNSGALNDVQSGSTGSCSPAVLCTAGAAWDGPSGLGSPDGVAAFAPPAVPIRNPGDQTGRVGLLAALALRATPASGLPLTWSAAGLPPGLAIAADNGQISGTPTAPGTFAVTVTAVDAAGAGGSARFVWTVAVRDITPPTATITAPTSPITTSTSVRVSWTGSDVGSGVAYYQVRYVKAAWNSGFGPAAVPLAWTRLTTTSVVSSALAKGYTYCWSVRAVDRASNVSGWSAQRCAAVPLDDRSMTASGGWGRGTGSAYWAGTVTSGGRLASTLTRTGAQVHRVAVMATRCTTCGVVGVYVNGRLLGKINLYGRTAYRVVYALPTFSLRTATVVVKVLSSGKRVQIDALALSRV